MIQRRTACLYVAGPEGMVQAARSMLVVSAVDEGDIPTEEFSGY